MPRVCIICQAAEKMLAFAALKVAKLYSRIRYPLV